MMTGGFPASRIRQLTNHYRTYCYWCDLPLTPDHQISTHRTRTTQGTVTAISVRYRCPECRQTGTLQRAIYAGRPGRVARFGILTPVGIPPRPATSSGQREPAP